MCKDTICACMVLYAPVLDLVLVFTGSLGARASTKVESLASFTESQKISPLTIFFSAMLNTKIGKTITYISNIFS